MTNRQKFAQRSLVFGKRVSETVAAPTLAGALFVAVAPAAPGQLDPGFGTGGLLTTATAPGAASDFQNGLAIQRDGGILVGGGIDFVCYCASGLVG
jgi:hypothetical protein